MELLDLIKQAENKLATKYPLKQARYEAKLLTIRILGWERWQLREHLNDSISQVDIKVLQDAYNKRSRGVPIAYILGCKEFYSLDFTINKNCLIPRPESEEIVTMAISHCNQLIKSKDDNSIDSTPSLSILDLGCGSGCLAISCLYNLGCCQAWLTDIEYNCLIISRNNAIKHNVNNRMHYWCGNWESAINPKIRFDCIISNPPYLSVSEINNELVYEPESALNGGINGLEPYPYLLNKLGNRLSKEGCFIFEYHNKYDTYIKKQILKNNWKISQKSMLGNIGIIKVTKESINK